MKYLGCHLSASAGNLAMVRTAEKIGANTFAFFTRNPRGSKAKKEAPADCAAAMEALREKNFGKTGCPWGIYHEPVYRRPGSPQLCLRCTLR